VRVSHGDGEQLATDEDAIVAPYGPDHMEFCRSEFDRLFIDDSELLGLCADRAERFIPEGIDAVPPILELVEDRLRRREPLSALRVGNGEGNAISMAPRAPTRTQARAFYHEFISQNGIAVPLADVLPLCRDVRAALVNADVLGFRSVKKFRTDERGLILDAIERKDAYAALGLIYARDFIRDGLVTGYLRGKLITSAWLHLDLLPALDRLLGFAESVVVITGREGLENEFRARLGDRLTAFISVPVQGVRPTEATDSHIHAVYPQVRGWLKSRDLGGTLVLVGAGLFGKVYIDDARNSGAVALDLGSAFDMLAGLATRPVHQRYDIGALSWLPVADASAGEP
jgi:hypothetical protein